MGFPFQIQAATAVKRLDFGALAACSRVW